MGFFDSVKDFFNDVGRTIKDAGQKAINWVSDKAPGVVNTGKDVVTWVANKGESAVNNVYNDAKTYLFNAQGIIGGTVQNTFKTVDNVVNTAGGTISNLGNSLSMPLVIGCAIVGGILLLRK